MNFSKCTECVSDNSEPTSDGCKCSNGYYSIGDPISKISCIKCDQTCLTCSDSFPCVQCDELNGYEYNKACYCNSGFYSIGSPSSSNLCKKCENNCLECNNFTICTKCLISNAIITDLGCICPDGYYENTKVIPNICEKCNENCLKCQNIDNCLLCKPSFTLMNGICSCDLGLYQGYDENNEEICYNCKSDCKNCLKFDYCIECISENTYLNDGKCSCRDGYWNLTELNSIDSCRECDLNCELCTSIDSCQKCKDKNTFIKHNKCTCKVGYWSSSTNETQTCLKCFENCLNCNNNTFCLECSKEYINKNGECIKDCSNDCEKCQFDSICLICKDKNSIYNRESKICECSQGWFKTLSILNHECIKCPDLCLSCNESLKCDKCSENSILDGNLCKCNPGYKLYNDTCIKTYFSLNLSVSPSNILKLEFSESLSQNLNYSAISIKVDKNKMFTYKLISLSTSKYIISLNFDLSIANGTDLSLAFKLSPILSVTGSELDIYDYNSTLNQFNFIDPFLNDLIDSTKALAQGATISAVSASFSNPSSLWILLNTLQLITYCPLSTAKMTPAMKKLCRSLADIKLSPNFLSFVIKNDTNEPLTKELIDCGIDSWDFWLNSGQNLTIFVFFLLLWPILHCISTIKVNWISKRFRILSMSYRYGYFIRFWIQGYLDFGIFALLSLTNSPKQQQNSENYINYFSSGFVFVTFT